VADMTAGELRRNLAKLEEWITRARKELGSKDDNHLLTEHDLDRLRKESGAPSAGPCMPAGTRD
jgi:hypothetical protein